MSKTKTKKLNKEIAVVNQELPVTDPVKITSALEAEQAMLANYITQEYRSGSNDSERNENDEYSADLIDDQVYNMAKKDPTTQIAKSSLQERGDLIVPKAVKLPKDKTTVVAKSSVPTPKGDEDAPFFLVADDTASRQYGVYDEETDRLIPNAFYANRFTGNILIALKSPEGQAVVAKDEDGEYPVLVLKSRKVYFKKNLSL